MYKIVHQQDQHDIFNKLYFNSKVFKTRQLHNNNLLNIKRSTNKFEQKIRKTRTKKSIHDKPPYV